MSRAALFARRNSATQAKEGTTHRRLFTGPGLAIDTFADVAAVVEELAATQLPGDHVIQGVWKQARRVEDPRGPRNGAGEQPAAAAATNATVAPDTAA